MASARRRAAGQRRLGADGEDGTSLGQDGSDIGLGSRPSHGVGVAARVVRGVLEMGRDGLGAAVEEVRGEGAARGASCNRHASSVASRRAAQQAGT